MQTKNAGGKNRVYLYNKGQLKVQKINTQKIQKIQKGNAQKIQKGNAQKIQKLRAVRADEETQKQQLISSQQIVRKQTSYNPGSSDRFFQTDLRLRPDIEQRAD